MSNKDIPKLSSKVRNTLVIIFGIFMIFCVIAPNLKLIASPFTPKIHGKAIDENTGKPIKDMLVLITHEIRYCYVPGNGYVNYKNSVLVKMDENGEFTSNRMLKPMSFTLFGMFDRDYDGSYVITLNNDYKYIADKIPVNGKIILNAKKILDVEDLRKNHKVYDLIEKDNYPTNIRKVVSEYKIEATARLIKYN